MTSAFPLENLIKNQRCWFTSDLCIENPCTPSFPAFLHFYIGIFQPLYTNSWVAKKLMGNFSFTSKNVRKSWRQLFQSFANVICTFSIEIFLRQKELAFLLVGHFFKISGGSRSSFLSKKRKFQRLLLESPLSPLFSFASINSKCSLKGRRQEVV